MSKRAVYIIALLIGLVGFGLIAWQAGWLTALGIFLVLSGNNVQQRL